MEIIVVVFMADGQIGGGKLFLVGIVGALVEAGIASTFTHTPFFIWAVITFIIGIALAFATSKATKPSVPLYLMIFFMSTSLSIFGIMLAYFVLKTKHLTQ